jgi:SPW repeat
MATYRQTDPITATRTSPGDSDPGGNGTAMAAALLNLLVGAWLFVSYWILDYSAADPGWNALVFGAAIGLFAVLRLSGVPMSWIFSAANFGIGVWLVISAFTIADSDVARTNFVLCGAAALVLALFAAIVRSPRTL